MKWIFKPYRYAIIFSLCLSLVFGYHMLATFVLPSNVQRLSSTTTSSQKTASSKATTSDKSYEDENISIQLEEKTIDHTQVYIAHIKVSSSEYLKTALAQNAFGNNVVAKTSETADQNQAILAVNGDYYGANQSGYVIRNGQILRDSVRQSSDKGDLAIYKDGSFKIIKENEVSAQELLDQGVVNLLAFGPSLVEDGQISVEEGQEVGQAMASNPRTAIGQIDENNYLMVVSDGRTSESQGLSLYQLAQVMKDQGAKTAYNLDGGGSSTMYFNGAVINKPTTNGSISERAVSDIVYIGY